MLISFFVLLSFGNQCTFCQFRIIPLFEDDTIFSKKKDTLNIINGKQIDGIDPSVNSTTSRQLSADSVFIQKTRKYDLKNEIRNMIVVSSQDEASKQQKKDYDEAVNSFLPYKGKTIRNISLKQLDVFGQSIADTTQRAERWYERLSNKLHINTREKILKNRLLISPGDQLDPPFLADNERLIREMPNIQDTRVIVSETGTSGDSVDLLFISKDVFSLGFGFELFDVNQGKAGIWNKNLLGIGHELYYYLLWDFDKSPNYGHKLRYRINNIGKTFVSADASYEKQWNIEASKLYFNRDFFTPQTKYAGGAGFEKIYALRDIILPDTIYKNYSVSYNYYDLWLGHAIILKYRSNNKIRSNITVTGRVIQYNYFKRPQVTESLLYDYHMRSTLLGSVGFSRQAFLKTKLIYGFGKLEDLPYGSLFSATVGYEISEFHSRPYLRLSYSTGAYIDNFGFFYQRIDYGSFFHHGIEQGVFSFTGKYFTRLMNPIGRYHYRVFTNLSYKAGIKQFEDEYIELSNNEGIRGLSSDNLRGKQRAYMNIESVCYSPHAVYKFRFVYFLFLDAGIVSNTSEKLLKNPIYTGFGVGLRIRNENLVFNTIQFRLAYYPLVPNSSNAEYIQLTGASDVRHETFTNNKPEILNY
jgi:hypothetical protein